MSRRTWFDDQRYTSQGMLEIDFSFVTNGTADPDPTLFRGCGGLTGSSVGNGLPNTSPSAIASIIRVGQGVGTFLITLVDGYRFVTSCNAHITDAADSAMARWGAFSNEGSGHTTPVTGTVVVRNAATNALLETTGRRVYCTIQAKDSGNGS